MTPIEQQRRRYYQTTPYVNYNPAAQNLLGNFFSEGSAARNATRYVNPQYQGLPLYNGQQMMIPAPAQAQGNQALAPYVAGAKNFVDEYVTPQLIRDALLITGGGIGTMGGVASKAGYPLAIMAASKIGQPAVNAVNRVANSPVGKWGAKLIDWAF